MLKHQMGLVGVWGCVAEEIRNNEIKVNHVLILLKVNAENKAHPLQCLINIFLDAIGSV